MSNRLLVIILFFTSVLYQACGQINLTIDNTEELAFAKEVIQVIKVGDKNELKSLMHENLLNKTEEEQLDTLIKQGQEVLDVATIPPDSLVTQSYRMNFSIGKKIKIINFSFPFSLPSISNQDSTIYFNIVVSGNKIWGINFSKYSSNRKVFEPEYSYPHLEKHSLSYHHIKWFRIWYGSGYQENEYGDSYGYYAVSGDKSKLDKLNIERELSEVFEIINNSQMDSIDFKYSRDRDNGDPEYIYFRFKFDHAPYNESGEFSIYYYLSEEPGKPEPLSAYIILRHSNKTRYLLKKENHPRIVELLRDITYREYDDYFEARWR